MSDTELTKQRFVNLKCCVIIPTYNNDQTLERLIREVGLYTDAIIIINDGSTDRTSEILTGFPQYSVLTNTKNKGKGVGLKRAFRFAISKGFRYAITIDSDGQHFPEDIPRFLDKVTENDGSVVIGARNMSQDGVPVTSSFGHKFSIFWFRIETGQQIPDVQSGYRLYPLDELKGMRFSGRKYEFEVEVLVRLAWNGVLIHSVPVNVWYGSKENRISHFRKFRDFARVSIMNAILVFIAIFWMNPLKFVREVRKKTVRKFIQEYIIDSSYSNLRIAVSVAIGLFCGIIPIWGFQMLAAFGAAYVLKLNKFVAVAASNISIPPLLPVIIFLSYITGGYVLGSSDITVKYNPGISLHWFKANLWQYLVGSVVFGIILGLVLGATAWILLQIFRRHRHGIQAPAE